MTTAASQLQASADQSGGKVKIIAGYALQQRLGSGSFATVYKGVKVAQSPEGDTSSSSIREDTVAVKAITRTSEKLTKKVLENLEMEISILRTYRHPNIVCLHDVQKTERHFYLILEYCGGGDVQRLIRTRKAGRISERLARRLMRDLSAGLKFLWTQELIHRDIKPQNLLLTGPLPLDEVNDPAKMDVHEEMRNQENFPSSLFALKIADFGFARHLQTTSLAETLCGSPLYMAPEILQHQRYDAKADLWSVGTVLFEMIAGKPPFNGDNHIDLLRNIQRKAVRLPNGVVVSKEGVNLLRILLNRNPLSRAGFKEFFVACDAFVALGCEGTAQAEDPGSTQHTCMKMDLGTIHEDQGNGAASMMTSATEGQTQDSSQVITARTSPPSQPYGLVTPPSGPMPSPSAILNSPVDTRIVTSSRQQQHALHPKFAPLQPSPPQSAMLYPPGKLSGPTIPAFALDQTRSGTLGQIQLTTFQQPNQSSRDGSIMASQTSGEDSEFVMVEHHRSDSSSPSSSSHDPRSRRMSTNDRHGRGMLSTSPASGGMLVGLMGLGSRPRFLSQNSSNESMSGLDSQIDSACKMISAAEDVGRRAISVAHLGDTRAYMAMRCLVDIGSGSSVITSIPMEGVDEVNDEHSSANVTDEGFNGVAGQTTKRPTCDDRSMADVKTDEDDEEEMPFALAFEADQKKSGSTMPIPTRTGSESVFKKSAILSTKTGPRITPKVARFHFGEALSCYLKALSMIKSVLGAVQKVQKDVEIAKSQTRMNAEQANRIDEMLKKCDTTTTWLSGQFTGVLERADAANVEITKFPVPSEASEATVTNVKELVYNHSLACGRDAAVKQLLGQFDAARSCYRTAGLLAETLLMEPNVGPEDRRILEGYVDGFAARITELDSILLDQSRRSVVSGNGTIKPGSGVIGIIGGIPATHARFDSLLPPMRTTQP